MHLVARVNQSEGIEGPQILPAVGATLVVARFAHGVRRQQGDHKGRPYVILSSLFIPIAPD